MVFPKARLAASALLFVAWIGFLAYLVIQTRDPVILSRPQLAVSSLVVVAAVEDAGGRPASNVSVKKVAWMTAGAANLEGSRLGIEGLPECGPAHGWRGAGDYILALSKRPSRDSYEITPLPLSPGYIPLYVTVELERLGSEKDEVAKLWAELAGGGDQSPAVGGARLRNVPRQPAEEFKRKLEKAKANVRLLDGESRIYPATPDALKQLEEIQQNRQGQ